MGDAPCVADRRPPPSGGSPLLHDEQEVHQHDRADDDAVDAERGEVVLLDEAHQELDRDDRDDERDDQAGHEHHPLGGGVGEAVLEELQQAPAEHDRDGKEERELGGDGARGAHQHRADDDGAGARRAGDDGEALEDADDERLGIGHLLERVDRGDDAGGVVFGVGVGIDRLVGLGQLAVTRMLAVRGGALGLGEAVAVADLDQDEDDAVDDERGGDHDGGDVLVGHDVGLDPLVEQQAHNGSGDGADDHLGPDSPGHALLPLGFARRERVELVEEQHEHRHDGAQLDDHEKRAVELGRHVQRDERLEQHHMARRRDRQPFGDALDDAEEDCLERFDDIHGKE